MQIVIDDKKIIDLLETEWGYEGIREDVRRLLIENGTPLPKGHGRLIDADECLAFIRKYAKPMYAAVRAILDPCKTIIEADKAESEG